MTDNDDTPHRLTPVAIDIAKHYHDVLIEPPTRGRRRRLLLANNLEDFEQLAGYVRSLKSSVLKRPGTIIDRWRIFSTLRASSRG
jgi:hypothetical protein